jgi:hypothetical protein
MGIEMKENEYRELYSLKIKLHKLMKKIILAKQNGCIGEEGIECNGPESLSLDLAGGELYSCIYYEQVRFCDKDSGEYEFDEELNKVKKIVEELNARWDEIINSMDREKVKYILNQDFKLK